MNHHTLKTHLEYLSTLFHIISSTPPFYLLDYLKQILDISFIHTYLTAHKVFIQFLEQLKIYNENKYTLKD